MGPDPNDGTPSPMGGVRASARMIAALAKQPAWVESMSPETRATIITKLQDALANATTDRQVMSISRALASLERNDIDRTRLFLDAEKQDAGETAQDTARKVVSAVEEIERLEGGLGGG